MIAFQVKSYEKKKLIIKPYKKGWKGSEKSAMRFFFSKSEKL